MSRRQSDAMTAAGWMVLAVISAVLIAGACGLGWIWGHAIERADWMPTGGQLMLIALILLAGWWAFVRRAGKPSNVQAEGD